MPSHLWFTPRMLMTEMNRRGWDLGIVIDLTNTSRYYHNKVCWRKLLCLFGVYCTE